jgi:hypothetical protein
MDLGALGDEAFFQKFGERLPEELWWEHENLEGRIARGAA